MCFARGKCILKSCRKCFTELQIRGGNDDNSKIFFLISQQNIHCDPSLESSRRDGFYEGSQSIFMEKLRNIIPKLSSYLFLSGTMASHVTAE